MTAIVADASRGITDRFRSLPMAGSAVVAGRGVADLLSAAVGLVVLMACGALIGWSWHEGAVRALGAVALLLWLRFAMIWLGLFLGLVAGKPEAVAAVQILVWPVGLLSNAFSDPGTMPGWLGTIAEWNPLSATAAAARELFGNPGWDGSSWAGTHAVELALAWPLVLTSVFLPLAVARYRALGR
jgi:ABC-type multidrug transport system permease subunit